MFCDIHSPLRACARAAVFFVPGTPKCRQESPERVGTYVARGDAPSPRRVKAGLASQIHSFEGGPLRFSRCARRFRSRSRPPRCGPRAPSHASPGAAAARRCPGKLLWKLDPGAIDRLARAGCRRAPSSSRRRTGRRRRPRCWRRSCGRACGSPTTPPARTSSRASPPPSSTRATPSSASSRSTRPLSRRSRGASGRGRVLLGNLFRDQLDRYGELELVAARWRDAVAALPETLPRRQRRRSRRSATSLATTRARASSASTTRATRARPCSTRPTRSTACAAARRTTTRPPTSGTSATTAARTAATRARTLDVVARDDRAARARRLVVHAHCPGREARVELRAARALQRLQRARRGGARTRARRAARRRRRRAAALRRRVRPLRADHDRRPHAADAADQEPGRRERGGAHARRGRARRRSR